MLLLKVPKVFHMSSVTVQFNLNSTVAGALLHLCSSEVMEFSACVIECNHNATLRPILVLYIIVNKGGILATKKLIFLCRVTLFLFTFYIMIHKCFTVFFSFLNIIIQDIF